MLGRGCLPREQELWFKLGSNLFWDKNLFTYITPFPVKTVFSISISGLLLLKLINVGVKTISPYLDAQSIDDGLISSKVNYPRSLLPYVPVALVNRAAMRYHYKTKRNPQTGFEILTLWMSDHMTSRILLVINRLKENLLEQPVS